MLEMAAVTYDGEHGAETTLEELRSANSRPWLSEVSVIEHDADGSFSVKAKDPSVGEDHAAAGAAIGGLTGVFVGLIGGPLGLILWGTLGALTGGAIGAAADSAFKPMVAELESKLAPDASMLVLVGETEAIEDFVAATEATDERVIRHPLSSEQAAELDEAARAATA